MMIRNVPRCCREFRGGGAAQAPPPSFCHWAPARRLDISVIICRIHQQLATFTCPDLLHTSRRAAAVAMAPHPGKKRPSDPLMTPVTACASSRGMSSRPLTLVVLHCVRCNRYIYRRRRRRAAVADGDDNISAGNKTSRLKMDHRAWIIMASEGKVGGKSWDFSVFILWCNENQVTSEQNPVHQREIGFQVWRQALPARIKFLPSRLSESDLSTTRATTGLQSGLPKVAVLMYVNPALWRISSLRYWGRIHSGHSIPTIAVAAPFKYCGIIRCHFKCMAWIHWTTGSDELPSCRLKMAIFWTAPHFHSPPRCSVQNKSARLFHTYFPYYFKLHSDSH